MSAGELSWKPDKMLRSEGWVGVVSCSGLASQTAGVPITIYWMRLSTIS